MLSRLGLLIVHCIAFACLLPACTGKQADRAKERHVPEERASVTAPAVSRPAGALPAGRVVVGTSVQGRPIEMIRFGAAPRPLLVIAGIHGDEPTSWYVAERLIALLESSPELVGGGSVVVVPRANPDGCAAGRRTNAAGVNVNRNFPASNWKPTRRGPDYTGPSPASEPETVAILRAVGACRPGRIVSIHSIPDGRQCNNYDGPAGGLAAAMGRHNGYPVSPYIGYATPGSFGTWAGIDRRLPVVTLELPHRLPGERAWSDNREALLAAAAFEESSGEREGKEGDAK